MKHQKRKGRLTVLFTIIIVVLLGFGLVRRMQQGKSTLAADYIRPGGDTIAVAIEMSPLTYNLSNDTADGFDYQVLRHIARDHKLKMKFVPVTDIESALQGLREGKYDLFVGNLPANTPLKEQFPVTDAVYLDRQVLVQMKNDTGGVEISNVRQLADDTVWIVDGSPVLNRINNLSAEIGAPVYAASIAGLSSEHLVILSATGQLPRAVVNEAIACRMAKDYPMIDISTPLSLSQFQSWVAAPGDTVLVDSLNRWLETFKQSAPYDSLVNKYIK